MRALVKAAPGPGMALQDVPVPPCGPTDVLIRVHHAGVCGTDLHIWEWDSWASNRLKPPVVIGHEFAGEIVELGREAAAGGPARGRRPGDRRGPHRLRPLPPVPAGRGAPLPAHPDHRRGPRRRLRRVHRDAGLERHAPRRHPHRDRRHHGPDGQRGAHGARGRRSPGSTVLVLGCGPIGCFAVGVARAAGRVAGHRQRLQPDAARARPRDGRARDAQPGDGRRAGPGARAHRTATAWTWSAR